MGTCVHPQISLEKVVETKWGGEAWDKAQQFCQAAGSLCLVQLYLLHPFNVSCCHCSSCTGARRTAWKQRTLWVIKGQTCSRKRKAQKAGEHNVRADEKTCILGEINDIPTVTLLRMRGTPPLAAWLHDDTCGGHVCLAKCLLPNVLQALSVH